jgi:hypothetical protein
MDDPTTWQRLCALLDDDEHLWPGVQAALRDAASDPWEALIDGLDEAGALAYLDSGDTGMELTDALAQLPRVYRLQPDLDEVNDTDDLDDAVRLADAVLGTAGHRLLQLDDPDDEARALVVVPAEAAPEVVRIAADLDHPVKLPD